MHWKEHLHQLACPACKAPLALTPAEDALQCASCNRVYPVTDGIPILLLEKAKATVVQK